MGKTKRFACPEANLLPVTKFVGNGLLIKCLGQVDLPNAPLDIVFPIHLPSPCFSSWFSLYGYYTCNVSRETFIEAFVACFVWLC